MDLYTKKGWLNAPDLIESDHDFIMITGARGIGKTYGTLKYLYQHKKPFIYMRRTEKEALYQNKELTSTHTKILKDLKYDYAFRPVADKTGGVFVDDQLICINIALSTFSSIRGISLDDIEYLVYDEFIAEPHVKKIQAEGMAFANLYESINRNREMEDRKALKAICLSNSLNMQNDIFMEFNLIGTAEKMIQNDIEQTEIDNLLLVICMHSPISEKKKAGALYRQASEEYARMAIKNEFILDDFTYVKRRDLRAYTCIWSVGDLSVYKHKSDHSFYVCQTPGQTKNRYAASFADLEKMKRNKWRFYGYYLDGLVYFDSYKSVSLFEKYFA
jgi:hypothetical protein